MIPASPFADGHEWRISHGPGRAPARMEDPSMELAAVVLFSSVVLWFVEEAADEHV